MAEKENWSRVRDKTDRGELGDKVDHPDPAAAPLGTDEEAGGRTTPPEDIAAGERRRSTGNPVQENDHRARYVTYAALLFAVVLIALFLLL